jgi:hypothetical protein
MAASLLLKGFVRPLSGASLNAYNRPTAAARWFRQAVIQKTAVIRNLPDSQFTQLGRNGRSGPAEQKAAVSSIAAVHRASGPNERKQLFRRVNDVGIHAIALPAIAGK